MNQVSTYFFSMLVLVHLGLLVWGVLGFVEYFVPSVPWIDLQNPAFPAGMQFLHWVAIVAGGGTFLFGYVTKWQHTPVAMSLVYTMMATLCAVQTLDMLTNSGRYLAMALEYIAYVSIVVFLFRSAQVQQHFRRH